MKVYLTGGTGFIGTHIRQSRLDDLFLYTRDCNLHKTLHSYNPDVILHVAGEIYEEDKMFDTNLKLTYDLLNCSRDIPYKAFIYVGSSSEYGYKTKPMKETDLLEPRTMYEATKGAATLLCQGFAKTYQKPVMIARPFSVYGSHEPETRLIPTIIRSLENNTEFPLSEGVHDYVHIDDFIDGIMLLVERPCIGGIFNFGSGVEFSNHEVVKHLECITGKTARTVPAGQMRMYDSLHWCSDSTKARDYGWNPQYSLFEGLKEVLYERSRKTNH